MVADFNKKMLDPEFKDKFTNLSQQLQELAGQTIHITVGEQMEQTGEQISSGEESLYWTQRASILNEHIEHGFSIIDREIYITHEVDSFTPQEIDLKIKTIIALSNDEETPIKIIINNYGGDVYALMGTYDSIRLSNTPIHTFAKGCAMSAGALLLAFGKHRVMTENSTVMFHDYSGGLHGTTKDWVNNTAHMEHIQGIMYKLLGEHSNKNAKWWKNKLQRDVYFTAEECLKLGIIDEVV